MQGTPFSGKTSLARHLAETFKYHLIDFEKVTPIIKERLGGEEAPEELPFEAYCKYFAEEIHKLEEGEMIIFDGWNQSIADLKKLFHIVGNPKCLVKIPLTLDLPQYEQGPAHQNVQKKEGNG